MFEASLLVLLNTEDLCMLWLVLFSSWVIVFLIIQTWKETYFYFFLCKRKLRYTPYPASTHFTSLQLTSITTLCFSTKLLLQVFKMITHFYWALTAVSGLEKWTLAYVNGECIFNLSVKVKSVIESWRELLGCNHLFNCITFDYCWEKWKCCVGRLTWCLEWIWLASRALSYVFFFTF